MQSRGVLLSNRLIGSYKLDVATVWLQKGNHTHYVYDLIIKSNTISEPIEVYVFACFMAFSSGKFTQHFYPAFCMKHLHLPPISDAFRPYISV